MACEGAPLVAAPERGLLHLHIRMLDGRLLVVETDRGQLVKEVKIETARQLGVTCTQKLVSGTEVLEDWLPLGSYGEESLAGELQLVLLTEEPPRRFVTFKEEDFQGFLQEEPNLLSGYVPQQQWSCFAAQAREAVARASSPGWRLLQRWLPPFLFFAPMPCGACCCVFFGLAPSDPMACELALFCGSPPGLILAWSTCICCVRSLAGRCARRRVRTASSRAPDRCDTCLDCWGQFRESDEHNVVGMIICSLAKAHFRCMNVSFRHVRSERVQIDHPDDVQEFVRTPGRLEVECWCLSAPSVVSAPPAAALGKSAADVEAGLSD